MFVKDSLLLQIVIVVALTALTFIRTSAGANNKVQTNQNPLKISVFDWGDNETARRVQAELAASLARVKTITLLDKDLSEAAARGAGYDGSLNLTVEAAKRIGASIGCDFYLLGQADTVRRSSIVRRFYYESYEIVFIVSARTGRLVAWERVNFNEDKPETARANLINNAAKWTEKLLDRLQTAHELERRERAQINHEQLEIIELPDEPEIAGFRVPLPFKRLRPAYTALAAEYLVEATVDAMVSISKTGAVTNVEIVRWAGFGLDEETAATIRKLDFRAALRDGTPVAVRFLLRYNFRRQREELTDEPN